MLFAAFLFARMKTLSGGRELWVLRAGNEKYPKKGCACVLRSYISPGEREHYRTLCCALSVWTS